MGSLLSLAVVIIVGGIVQVKVCNPRKNHQAQLAQLERTHQATLQALHARYADPKAKEDRLYKLIYKQAAEIARLSRKA